MCASNIYTTTVAPLGRIIKPTTTKDRWKIGSDADTTTAAEDKWFPPWWRYFFLFHLYIIYIFLSPLALTPSGCQSVCLFSHSFCVRTNTAESGATRRLIYTPNPLLQKYRRTNPTGLMCLKYRGSGNCNRNLVCCSHTVPRTHTHSHTHTLIIYRKVPTIGTHCKIQLAKNSLNTRSRH